MCRGLAYLGPPILLDDLLFKSDSSLVKQSYLPRRMTKMLNLAGFGMSLWEKEEEPLMYKTIDLPFYDKNLKSLAENNKAKCLIAHIRGVSYSLNAVINQQNAHPFLYPGAKVALAHNGHLSNYEHMKYDLHRAIRPDVLRYLSGTTDSEIMYAIMLSQLKDPFANPTLEELTEAVMKMLWVLKKIRKKYWEFHPSAVNLFISNGEYLLITRLQFNFGSFVKNMREAGYIFHTLFYTYGEKYGLSSGEYKMSGKKKKAVMFSSEPLTQDTTTWVAVQEYSMMTAQRKGDEVVIFTNDLDI